MTVNKSGSSIALLLLAIVMSACSGLAGEPEIVGELPPPPAPVAANASAPDVAPDLALGAQLYAQNCTRCHGIFGAGDGEFVLSGQISEIPDFTDPTIHQQNTADDYYTVITNGNLEKLMPPFSGSLTDEERWSVAHYVLTLADDNPADVDTAPNADTANTTDDTPPTNVGTVHSTSTDVAETGTINGVLLQRTIGASIPDSGNVTLTIAEMTGGRTTIETELAPDGSYQFFDVPLLHDAGYFVSFDYGNGTYTSEFASLTAASPIINLNIPIYETTDDASVIQMEVVLSQVDVLDDNTLQVRQLISVVNTSDKVFIYQDDRGQSVSVEVPAPQGVRLSPNIDLSRFVYSDNAVFDTRPVVPNTEHSFNLVYTVPFDGDLTFSQTFPYDFFGPYEAYADSTQLRVSSDGWRVLEEPQELEGISYRGIANLNGIEADENVSFRIQRVQPFLTQQTLGIGVIVAGIVLLLIAGAFYWRSSKTSAGRAEAEAIAHELMKQIAELDNQFKSGELAEQDYKKRRDALKARVVALMKQVEN